MWAAVLAVTMFAVTATSVAQKGFPNTSAAKRPNLPWAVHAESETVLRLTRPGESLRLQACSAAVVRVTYVPADTLPVEAESPMLVADSCPARPQGVSLRQVPGTDGGKSMHFTTGLVVVEFSTAAGALTFKDHVGKVLLRESDSPTARLFEPAPNSDGNASQVTQLFLPASGERFFGLGQHQSGVWNYSGESVDLTQDNTNISIPFFVSDAGYGVLWQNGGASHFNARFAQRLFLSSSFAKSIDYFFVYGPEADDVIRGYRQLTGQAPLFSRAAYGFWQSKNRYSTQAEIVGAAERYRALHIPIDNIVQDWFWWTKMGSHEFSSQTYPAPQQMVDQIHAQHMHVMISVWPFFEPGSANYDAFERSHHFLYQLAGDGEWLPGARLYDAFSAEARAMYWQQINTSLFAKGFDAWWLDTTEPETLNVEASLMQKAQTGTGPGAAVANLFPLMTTSAVYQGQRSTSQQKRVFILTRSAAAGMQRNAAAAWSGDTFATWDTLRRQVPAGLNYAMSGLPYWTTDIGGFVSGDPDDPAYRELFIRWFQYGTFCPIFRVHGTRTGNRNELWSYGAEAQGILTSFDQLRYRLLPYLYSAAWAVTAKQSTIMRPLVMDFRPDEVAGSISDQFLFGRSFLVSPVLHAGETTRRLYLPKGAGWYDFFTGTRVEGGRYIDAEAPLSTMPLHVRSGSIVPIGPPVQYADEQPNAPIEVRIYAGADADFDLYDDEGDGYGYEQGRHAIVTMHWSEARHRLTLEARKGAYPGMPATRSFHIVWVRPGHGAGPEMAARPDRVVEYTGRAVEVRQP